MFFFFSSRRRHTRLQGDWSSDVCSSDLVSSIEWATDGNADRKCLWGGPGANFEAVGRHHKAPRSAAKRREGNREGPTCAHEANINEPRCRAFNRSIGYFSATGG